MLRVVNWTIVSLILILALWGAAVLVAAGLYCEGWLPVRVQRSIKAGARIAYAEWTHMDADGKHLPRTRHPRRTLTPPAPTDAPAEEVTVAPTPAPQTAPPP